MEGKKSGEELLAEVYRNTRYALASIADILPAAGEGELKEEIGRMHEEYGRIAGRAALCAKERGIKVIIAAAGMAAHLCGVIASMTTVPVIGVPINSTLDGMDALLAIVQMPPGIPVATVGINGALNAAILSVQMLAVGDERLQEKLAAYKEDLKKKIVKANEDLAKVSFKYKTN